MERFKVLAKTGHIALLQVRFDSEFELKRFCDRLPCVKHVDQHDGVTVLSADEESDFVGAPSCGAALAACLIAPEFQDAP
ncbi:MAG TPA: hypothetical protein PJ986_11890 [Gammaproteobacteria bacterium]|nr:hypothetical protein [Gammaproteobacteria bacterium]